MTESKTIRILVTGSRTWINLEKITDTLELIRRQHPDTSRWVIVHGACPDGADAMVDAWAQVRGIDREPHPANWKRYGSKAGFKRNTDMVRKGADVCLAFLEPCTKRNCRDAAKVHGSHGTVHCSTQAREAGIATWTIRDRFPS